MNRLGPAGLFVVVVLPALIGLALKSVACGNCPVSERAEQCPGCQKGWVVGFKKDSSWQPCPQSAPFYEFSEMQDAIAHGD
jgi:hypothetical protein